MSTHVSFRVAVRVRHTEEGRSLALGGEPLEAQYQFDFGLRPSVAYLQSKGKNLGVINGRNYDDEDILKYVDVGATYYFNKNMSAVVDYKINLLKDNDFSKEYGLMTDNVVGLGLVYQF